MLNSLGAAFGKILVDSAGAAKAVDTIIDRSSTRSLLWAMGAIGAIIAFPFDSHRDSGAGQRGIRRGFGTIARSHRVGGRRPHPVGHGLGNGRDEGARPWEISR
ncbi:MAG: hypothetical protein QM662_01340 [Gordonia sp. (in: high G+C Gram-positive bacteria)]